MTPTTLLDLPTVPGKPCIKLNLPVPLRVGDKLRLGFKLKRQNGGRLEVLEVSGEFRVTSAHQSVDHQILSVESTGKEPSWKAVRREPQVERRIAPARFPRTVVT